MAVEVEVVDGLDAAVVVDDPLVEGERARLVVVGDRADDVAPLATVTAPGLIVLLVTVPPVQLQVPSL